MQEVLSPSSDELIKTHVKNKNPMTIEEVKIFFS